MSEHPKPKQPLLGHVPVSHGLDKNGTDVSASQVGAGGTSSSNSSEQLPIHAPSPPLPPNPGVLHGPNQASSGSAPSPAGLPSFTTSQLAGCCWALAVLPGGIDTPAFASAWVHLLQRLACGAPQAQQVHQPTTVATRGAAGLSDAVLSQIWQVGGGGGGV
jgi:hypothetical protein